MNLTRRHLLGVGAAAGATVLLSACDNGKDTAAPGPATSPRKGGTLRIGALGKASAITRDPHGVQNNESDYLIISLVYDALTVPGATSNVAPRLATKWESSADLKRWTFTIPDNATFHDGSPVTAEDVAWSLVRLRNTPSASPGCPGSRRTTSRPRAATRWC